MIILPFVWLALDACCPWLWMWFALASKSTPSLIAPRNYLPPFIILPACRQTTQPWRDADRASEVLVDDRGGGSVLIHYMNYAKRL
jgi:hypothetical protein